MAPDEPIPRADAAALRRARAEQRARAQAERRARAQQLPSAEFNSGWAVGGETRRHDLDGYVDAHGHLQPHQAPAEVETPLDLELDREAFQDIELLRDIHEA